MLSHVPFPASEVDCSRLAEFETLPPTLEGPDFAQVTGCYRGTCPVTGEPLTLPRTQLAERFAQRLVESLQFTEPKMYGVLLVRNQAGELGLLKAFSGKLEGSFHHPGWVPPMIDLEPTPLENFTKGRLAELKAEILGLNSHEAFQEKKKSLEEWRIRELELNASLAERKKVRHRQREMGGEDEGLLEESRADSRTKRDFKREQRSALEPLLALCREIEKESKGKKAERKALSRALQEELHQRFAEAISADQPWSLAALFPKGPPTGTGECCAPKLLHFANRHQLQPLAMAEIWWGASTSSRTNGQFYLACQERCQPLLGPLLSRALLPLKILFEDDSVVAVDKFSGLLTVPGRQNWNQDSLLLRLEQKRGKLYPIHRLDMGTSGVVLLAKSRSAQAAFQALFAQRKVKKVYHALLSGCPEQTEGTIDLPLSSEPSASGTYRPCPEGKKTLTHFRLLDIEKNRVEFRPLTGRSHQLRIHACYGLGCPILGDQLYGPGGGNQRLMLHAHSLELTHPLSGQVLKVLSPTPF